MRGLETRSPDRYVMQVLTTVLGGGMSSRLFLEVRERLGLERQFIQRPATLEDVFLRLTGGKLQEGASG